MRNCAHCGREVAADKQFCGYCGYRAAEPEIKTKKNQANQSKLGRVRFSKRLTVVTVVIIIIVLTGLISATIYFPLFNNPNPDTDGDGILDENDDYPTTAEFSAKLEVVDSNWYTVNNTLSVVIEFRNPKNFDICWVQTDISLTSLSGDVLLKDNTVLWSGNLLKPGQHAYSFWRFDYVDPGVEGYKISVKGENYKGNNKLNYPSIELLNNQGSLSEEPNRWGYREYNVTGQVKNHDSEEQIVSSWVGFYNAQGKLLDVNFDILPVIAPSNVESFEILSVNPDSQDIQTFNVQLVIEFL